MRNRWILAAGASLPAMLGIASPSLGAECAAPRTLSTIALTLTDNGILMAPATLVGQRKMMIVDTGGFNGMLFPGAPRQLGLATGNSRVGAITVDGAFSRTITVVPEIVFGRLRATNYKFLVEAGADSSDIPDDAPFGLIAADILQNYDVDFDFAASKLNLIDPNHCPGQAVYWQASKVAVIPFRMDKSFHITFPVTVDGKDLTAMLDTGASRTTMNVNVANAKLRIHRDAPDVEKIGELKGDAYTASIYQHQFKTIAFGDVVIRDPMVVLIPDMTKKYFPTHTAVTSLIPEPEQRGLSDLLIGMSSLSKLHVYIAYKERKLYITEAAAP